MATTCIEVVPQPWGLSVRGDVEEWEAIRVEHGDAHEIVDILDGWGTLVKVAAGARHFLVNATDA